MPSGESQSVETAQMSQLKSGEKERVDFTPEDQSEPSMWKTALMTATQNCLSAPVGGGLTEGMPSSAEELDSMSASGLGFGLLEFITGSSPYVLATKMRSPKSMSN